MVTDAAPTASPTLISGSRWYVGGSTAAGSGAGRGTGRGEGTDPDTQLVTAASSTGIEWYRTRSTPVVAKLELDPEVLSFEKGDHRLQLVA